MLLFILMTLIILPVCGIVIYQLYEIWKEINCRIFSKIMLTFLQSIIIIVLGFCEIYVYKQVIPVNDFEVIKVETIDNPQSEENEYVVFIECDNQTYLLYVPEEKINKFKENKIVTATFYNFEEDGIKIIRQY